MNQKNIYTDICYGCGACSNICPYDAIEMKENEKGFLMPVVDADKCRDCGLCKSACEYTPPYNKQGIMYVGRLKDDVQLFHSQSGGAFVAISDYVLSKDGVVYGCALDALHEAHHIRAVSKEERNLCCGSKYIQSRTENVFQMVGEDLKTNMTVLFSGTPCQVAGLYKYCKTKQIDTETLITVDLLCHGVPSILLWRNLLKYFEKKYSCDVQEVIFRDKSNGWGHNCHTMLKLNNTKYTSDLFGGLYFNNLALRESCYVCSYAKPERVGDFTIADAWGVKENHPALYDKTGMSTIVANNERALKLIPCIEKYMYLTKVDFEKYKNYNAWTSPSHPHRSIDEFWKDYSSKSFWFIAEKYGKNNLFLNYKYVLKRVWEKLRRQSNCV